MIELRNCGSSIPAAGDDARRRSSSGQSGSSGARDAVPAPSGAAASMDRQGFRASSHLDTLGTRTPPLCFLLCETEHPLTYLIENMSSSYNRSHATEAKNAKVAIYTGVHFVLVSNNT
jgi:hypothetical protein